jgi:hypothetical protein
MSRTRLFAAALVLVATAACQKEGSVDTKAVDELTTRVKALEEQNSKNAEAMAFLQEAYAGQKRQRDEQDAQEPAQDAVFAVDISQNLADQTDGPPDALVTIVEAWDFA